MRKTIRYRVIVMDSPGQNGLCQVKYCFQLTCCISLVLQTISGLRLTDTFLKRTYEYDEVAQAFIYDEQDEPWSWTVLRQLEWMNGAYCVCCALQLSIIYEQNKCLFSSGTRRLMQCYKCYRLGTSELQRDVFASSVQKLVPLAMQFKPIAKLFVKRKHSIL